MRVPKDLEGVLDWEDSDIKKEDEIKEKQE
jgi:hypothetical protein